jgi:prophage antirepressor-like protein
MNDLTIYNTPEFGQIEVLMINGQEHFTATKSAEALGYERPHDAIARHCRYSVKHGVPHPQNPDKTIEKTFIPEGDLYRLIAKAADQSRNPEIKTKAARFERLIYDEILPTIRKTGAYVTKPSIVQSTDHKRLEAEAKLNNSRARIASEMRKLAELTGIPDTYKQVLAAKAAEIMTGKPLLSLPEESRRTYSAEEIGERFRVSANMVGRLANRHNLKMPEYGLMVWDKSRHGAKQVQTWRYFDAVIPKFEEIFTKHSA